MERKKLIIGALLLTVVIGVGYVLWGNSGTSDNMMSGSTVSPDEKIYVALEGEGAIAILDGVKNKVIKTIPLTDERTGTEYMPHNVQVSPDGSVVWVTANAMAEMEHQSFRLIETAYANEGHEDTETMSDQVIAIDPRTDTITRRIPIGTNQHLAHVVQSSGDSAVFVVAQETDKIYVLNADTMTLERSIDLPSGSGPHGMRLSPDNKTLYVAFMSGEALGIVDVASGAVKSAKVDGAAVQTAVTLDGSRVAVSVYDSKSVGIYDVSLGSLSYVRLPSGSQGPVQLYPTEDSRFIYVADQGVLNGREANNKLYKIDLQTLSVIETIEAGEAPHGVALNGDGTRAYVTNLKGDSVSVIDTATAKEISEIKVGKEPNGVSVWNGDKAKPVTGLLEKAKITVYKSPTCGCCGNYIAELKRQGADVLVEEISDVVLAEKKKELGIRPEFYSCHTSLMDGYVVEGHVPIEALVQLRTERPALIGIALPGMPAGSPGMSGVKIAPFAVQTLEGELFGNF